MKRTTTRQRRNRSWLALHGETLETRRCLTTPHFAVHQLDRVDSQLRSVGWLRAVDIDNDQDLDIVTASHLGVGVYENHAGSVATERTPLVNTTAFAPALTQLIDMDQDGDLDIYGRYENGRHIWFERTEDGSYDTRGKSTFGIRQFVDLDGDGDLDGIAVRDHTGKGVGSFVWYETVGDELGVGPRHELPVPFYPPDSDALRGAAPPVIHPIDVDQDGDLDLVTIAYSRREKLRWHANLDGKGTFGPGQDVTALDLMPQTAIADFDNDGKVEFFIRQGDMNNSAQFWQFDSPNADQPVEWRGTRYFEAVIGSEPHATDLDGDGLLDIVAIGYEHQLEWYRQVPTAEGPTFERTPGLNFVLPVVLHDVADIDADGNDDLLVTTSDWPNRVDRVLWLRSTPNATDVPGDINGDAQVSFEDFLILAANFGKRVSVRTEGDLDVDGRVTFADFLLLSAEFAAVDASQHSR